MLAKHFKGFVQTFLPHSCKLCGVALNENEDELCLSCSMDIGFFSPVNVASETSLERLDNQLFKAVYVLLPYQKNSETQQLLYGIKYKGHQKIAVKLGVALGKVINNSQDRHDVIIPIPLHAKKYRIRGYNQSERIATGMKKVLDIPLDEGILKRIKHDKSLTSRSKTEREEQVKTYYSIEDNTSVEGKSVLLVDDVFTTGSTLKICASLLKEAGAKSVSVAVIAEVK